MVCAQGSPASFRIFSAAQPRREGYTNGYLHTSHFCLHRPPASGQHTLPRTPAAIKIRPCTVGQSPVAGARAFTFARRAIAHQPQGVA